MPGLADKEARLETYRLPNSCVLVPVTIDEACRNTQGQQGLPCARLKVSRIVATGNSIDIEMSFDFTSCNLSKHL
jgi:hypothetical protein